MLFHGIKIFGSTHNDPDFKGTLEYLLLINGFDISTEDSISGSYP